MSNNIISYVPNSEDGPHYMESGKRPGGQPDDIYSIQTNDGWIIPAKYKKDDDSFVMQHAGIQIEGIVCWSSKSLAGPNTEMEWFAGNMRQKGYVHGASPGGSPCCFVGHNPTLWRSEQHDTKEEANIAAYEHWVRNGRQ